MVHHLLLFVDFDAEAACIVENIVVVVGQVVNLARQTAAARNNQLSLRFEGVLPSAHFLLVRRVQISFEDEQRIITLFAVFLFRDSSWQRP